MQNRDFRVSEGPFLGQKTKTSVSRRYTPSRVTYFLLPPIFHAHNKMLTILTQTGGGVAGVLMATQLFA